jgi:hypothetical protein
MMNPVYALKYFLLFQIRLDRVAREDDGPITRAAQVLLPLQDWDEYLKHNQEYILNDKHLNNRKPKPSKILLSLHCAYNFIIVLMKDSKVLWLRDLFFIFCANCISLSVVPESNGPVQVSKEEKNEK